MTCRGQGRQWYEDGKFLKKKNTFTDFVAVAEHLIAHKYTSPARLCIEARPQPAPSLIPLSLSTQLCCRECASASCALDACGQRMGRG